MNAVHSGHAGNRSVIAAAVAAVLASATTAPAAAQTRASAIVIEEIVVTARKREESLLDVPLSVTAFTADALDRLRVQNPDDLARYTPGFSYTQSFGRNSLERPVIRGMSNILGTPNASFFVDGVYINGPAVSTELSNLERVEIIKGPQAALYGRATFSGAINYVTRRPTNEFEGKLSATGAEHEEYEVNGFLSGPIVEDKLFYYVGGRYWQYGGEWDNTVTGDEIGGQETQGGTVKLLWTPTESFEATLLATYSEDDDDHIPLVLQGREFNNCFQRQDGFPRSRGYYCGEVFDADDLPVTLMTELFPNGGGIERETTRAALTLSYDFGGGATFTSLTGYSDEDQATENDYTYGNYNPGGFWRIEAEDRESFSQELRLESSPEGRFRWLLGGYWFEASDDDVRQDQVLTNGSIAANVAAPLNEFDIENWAVFGSVDFDFTDKLTGTVELRYSEDEITQYEYPQTGAPTRVVGDTFTSTSPRVILSYQPTDDATVYVNYAQGNKPGTFNSGIASLAGAPEAVDEEESDNYELGAKLRMLDGRLGFNVAVYYIDWTNQQLTQNIFVQTPAGPVANSFIENVGQSEVKGLEVELNALLTDHWDLQFGWSYSDAKIVSYFNQEQADLTSPNALADLPTAADRQADLEQYGDVSGQRLPRTPEHQGFLVTTYRVPFGSEMEWFLSGDVTYEGTKYAQVHNLAKTGERAYFGLRTGIDTRHWNITLWGKNLTDDTTPTDILRYIDGRGTFIPPFLAFQTRGFALSMPRGRQVGLSATYRF